MAAALLNHQTELRGQIQNIPLSIQVQLTAGACAASNKLIDSTLRLLERQWDTFCSNHAVLRTERGADATEYFDDDHYTEVATLYLTGVGILESLRPPEVMPPAPVDTVQSREVLPSLPKATLPEFSGSYLEWEPFRDAFESMVVNRPDVPEVQKLILLKRALRGDAAPLVRNTATTAANFRVAWQTVCTRYTNERLLVHAHLSALHDLPQVTKESARDMRTLIDRTREELSSLRQLGRPVDEWDDLIVFNLLRRLDPASRREWELHLTSHDAVQTMRDPEYRPTLPTLAQFEAFIEARIRALEMTTATSMSVNNKDTRDLKSRSPRAHQVTVGSKKRSCAFCDAPHVSFACPTFRERSPQDRLNEVKRLKLCFNCLGTHPRKDCKSAKTCSRCMQTHNTLLHDACSSGHSQSHAHASVQAQEDSAQRGDAVAYSHTVGVGASRATALLTTALVRVLSNTGQCIQTRALLDSGSEVSFVSEDIVQRLRLPKRRSPVKVVGVGASHSASASSETTVVFESRLRPGVHHRMEAFVLARLTAHGSRRTACPSALKLPSHIQLADPEYYQDKKVGLILGADIYGSLLRPGVCEIADSKVVAINTALGWVLSGTMTAPSTTSVSTLHCRLEDDLDRTLRRFWEVEEVPSTSLELTPEQRECEDHFVATHSRDSSGRFVVRLPRKAGITCGDNRQQAVRSLLSIERRLAKEPTLSEQYHRFMSDYELLGHMKRTEEVNQPAWYLPHHAVVQSGPRGDKLRVVFDASRLNSHGVSLNQQLHPGPVLQNDLGTVIINWRHHRVVFCADVVKMFRQILVHPEDQDLQRIVWRANANDAIQDFRLATVTYGTACAPYLAIRVLHEIAHLEKDRYPRGSECLRRDAYVDDILAGADSVQEARSLRDELVQTLATGCLELSKWSTNRPELLDIVQEPAAPGASPAVSVELAESTRMLGILWNPARDEFQFQEGISTSAAAAHTKRAVLSQISQLFDPLGWIAPVTIIAKVLLQDIWIAKCDWDEPLRNDLAERWAAFQASLGYLTDIRIPRWTQLAPDNTDAELHGFADASTRAYAAVIYLRIINSDGQARTAILASKTKAAPVRTISVPRLELCAAQLLVKLLLYVRQSHSLADLPMYGWSDSTVTLAWIRSHPSRWKTFVANRSSYIQSTLPELKWRHVTSSHNPADIASRGASPRSLAAARLWWDGPTWLSEPRESWPAPEHQLPEAPGEEASQKAFAMPAHVEHAEFELLERYSSLTRLIRVTAYCMRFARRCDKARRILRLDDAMVRYSAHDSIFLTAHELADARTRLIRSAQRGPFANEIERLTNARPVSRSSPLASLHPILDKQGVLRVGGRLENANITQARKHPPILPKCSPLSQLFIRHAHLSALHAGFSLTFSLLQEQVWVLRGRVQTKKLLRDCITCRRRHPQMGRQLMGQLPAARVNPSRPFLRSGVDYAGPLKCRPSPGRGRQSTKAYIALFVCLSTKALHLEVVSDLTTAAFLAAFRRFVARRGICSELLSDNGTTFVGADAELRSMFQEASEFYGRVASTLADSGTSWHFIPPASPHFGGLWEAGVKSVKGLLRKTIGDATLTYEELSTVLAQVEACLNSRPLTPLSPEATDFSALTPAHFLVGSSLLTVPEPGAPVEQPHLVTRWRLVQQIANHFWRKWSSTYLHQLQHRSRWRGEKKNFTVGQLVLVHNPQLPPGKWALARVTELHPGADGLVRVVTVKTATSELRRPVARLSPLPVDASNIAVGPLDPSIP